MTNLFLKWSVPKDGSPDSPQVRTAVGKLSGLVGILCNLLLFAGKLLVGTLSGSVSITADALNNLSDASSSIVTLIGFRLAEKPADEDHPFGHARFEYLSGLAVAAMIVIIGFELGKTSIEKIISPSDVTFTLPAALVLLASIAVKLWMALFNRKLGDFIHSPALLATAADSRNDVLTTTAVLIAAAVEHFSSWRIDGIMGLAVAAFILYSGASLARDTISPLLGEGASPELTALIVATVRKYPEVLGFHDLMVHDYGPGQRFASLHVEMDQALPAMHCHELIDDIERECYKTHNIHLVIHYDPVVTGDAELEEMHTLVSGILAEYDSRLSLHDFRMVQGKGHTNLIFDVALPDDLRERKKEIKAYLDDTLAVRCRETLYTVITFDPAAFNQP